MRRKGKFQIYHEYLKQSATPAERRLLNAFKYYKIKYTFQKRIDNYFFDFHIKGTKLLIEVDGGYHNSDWQVTRDLRKEVIAKEKGYRVLRFKNREVWDNRGKVINIIKFCSSKKRVGVPVSSLTNPLNRVWQPLG